MGAIEMGEVRDRTDHSNLAIGDQSNSGEELGGPGGSPPDGLFSTFDHGGGDRDNLVQFLKDLEQLLRFVAENPQGIVPDELQAYIGPAWEVVQRRFDDAIAALQDVEETALEPAGLAGPELQMKLAAVNWAYKRLKAEVQKVPGVRRVPGALAAVLGFADVVADSIPVIGGFLHPILEHKQVVEKSAAAVDAAIG